LPEREVKKAQKIIKSFGFKSLNAGYLEKGEKQVIIKPKKIIYRGKAFF
jgi:predicted dinucleotide-binding enzyme